MTAAGQGLVETLDIAASPVAKLIGLRLVCVLKLEGPSSETRGAAIWWLEKGKFAEKCSVTCFNDKSPGRSTAGKPDERVCGRWVMFVGRELSSGLQDPTRSVVGATRWARGLAVFRLASLG